MNDQAILNFRRLGLLTIFAVYLVILAGGVVRASGAGMGCPDWPTCFGQWIPPTDESQLPADYHRIYAERGYENTQFNPVKTWTEYSNRLIGATTGLLVLLTAWASRIFLKRDKAIFWLSVTNLVLISFQGWLGSSVVASNLKPYMITLHMLMALLIVALITYTIARSQKALLTSVDATRLHGRFRTVLSVAIGMTLLQVAMGTQVRETVDFIAHEHSYIDRCFWREDFPILFYVHRSFSSLILFTNLWLVWRLKQAFPARHTLRRAGYGLIGLIVTAILAGISLDRLCMPAPAQPLHLLMASSIFGVQFFLAVALHYANYKETLKKSFPFMFRQSNHEHY